MHTFFAAIGRFSVRFRWLIVAAWVGAAVAAGTLFPSLSSVAQQSTSDVLSASSPSVQAARLAAPFQSLNDTPVQVVIARTDGTLTAADTQAIAQLATRLDRVHGVSRVENLGVSHDRQAALVRVLANVNLGSQAPQNELAAGLRHVINATGLPSDLRAHLTGEFAASVDGSQSSQQAANLGEEGSIVFILVLLLVVFRSVLAPLLTLGPAVLVTQLAAPVIAELTKAGLRVSSLTEIMLLILTLGAGTDYGLFLVFRVREELRRGRTPGDAVVEGLSRVGESITFSAGTVIAALLTLLLATSGIEYGLGAPLAIAIALMLAAGLTLLPALLAIFGRAAFWPAKTGAGTGRAGWWGRVASRVVTHPVATLAFGLLAFGGLAVAAAGYTPAGFGSTPPPPAGTDSAAGNVLLAAHFPAASANPTLVLLRFRSPVWDDLARVAAAERRLASAPEFRGLTGPMSVNGVAVTPEQLSELHAALGEPGALTVLPPRGSAVPPAIWAVYRAESQFISTDGRTVLFGAQLAAGDPNSNAAIRAVPAIRATVAAVGPGSGAVAAGVMGDAPALYDASQASGTDLLRIIPVAIVIIGLLLALVLRSLVAPVYLIASVVLSYLAAFGVAVLVFQDLSGAGGLLYYVPFVMFVFLLALGEDYNILVMTRIREEAGHVGLRQAVTRALERTGSTVTSAGLILAGTFGVFAVAVSGMPGGAVYRSLLASLSIGILMDAFGVRTLLVPSTVALLGRWNWWPSRHGAPALAPPERDGAVTRVG